MKMTIHTEGYFDSAHKLENYKGKCSVIHGHTWKVEVWVRAKYDVRDKAGILWDFGNLKKLLEKVDHKLLDIKINSTAENLTTYFYDKIKIQLNKMHPNERTEVKVRIYESIPKNQYAETGDW